MRAREPDVADVVVRDDVTLGFEVHGEEHGTDAPAVLLLPTWTIIHSRFWKFQVPDLARRHRVVTHDGPGNGTSDRVVDPARYTPGAYAADAIAVMDACDVQRAVVVGVSYGARVALELADVQPGRVAGLVLVAPSLALGPILPHRAAAADRFLDPAPESPEGWEHDNLDYWRHHFPEFSEWFFTEVFSEPHSSKAREDAVCWSTSCDGEVLAASSTFPPPSRLVADILADVRCPTLVVHGDHDRVTSHAVGVEAARLSGGALATFAGSGHLPNVRDPVRFNLLLRNFLRRVA